MAQHWGDLLLWEWLLNRYPVRGIVEIGTFQGGMSLFLSAQARARNLAFVTYDAVPPLRDVPGFERRDVFLEHEHVSRVLESLSPVALLCDGGNKPRELKMFGPGLRRGSFVVVHDWLTETFPKDVPDTMSEVHVDWCEQVGSISRVFVPWALGETGGVSG